MSGSPIAASQPRAQATRRQGIHFGLAEGEVPAEFEYLLRGGEAGQGNEERREQSFQTSLFLFTKYAS